MTGVRAAWLVALCTCACPVVPGNSLAPPPWCDASCARDADCVAPASCVASRCVPGDDVTAGMETVTFPGATTAVDLPFRVDAEGQGTDVVGNISVNGNAGSITVNGHAMRALAYEQQAFPAYTLFQVMAVGDGVLAMAWLYCRAGALTDVYVEATDGTRMRTEPASGACAGFHETTTVMPGLPRMELLLPPLLGGYAVSGPGMVLPDGRPGVARLPGGDFDVHAFSDVDCTLRCGPPGWREVHALLVERGGNRVGFGIAYLFPHDDEVQWAWAITAPDLQDPARDAFACARWTYLEGEAPRVLPGR